MPRPRAIRVLVGAPAPGGQSARELAALIVRPMHDGTARGANERTKRTVEPTDDAVKAMRTAVAKKRHIGGWQRWAPRNFAGGRLESHAEVERWHLQACSGGRVSSCRGCRDRRDAGGSPGCQDYAAGQRSNAPHDRTQHATDVRRWSTPRACSPAEATTVPRGRFRSRGMAQGRLPRALSDHIRRTAPVLRVAAFRRLRAGPSSRGSNQIRRDGAPRRRRATQHRTRAGLSAAPRGARGRP
jgi:hypothetical protein